MEQFLVMDKIGLCKVAVIIYGGGGYKFHCKQIEGGGAKIKCNPLEGSGAKFQCTDI